MPFLFPTVETLLSFLSPRCFRGIDHYQVSYSSARAVVFPAEICQLELTHSLLFWQRETVDSCTLLRCGSKFGILSSVPSSQLLGRHYLTYLAYRSSFSARPVSSTATIRVNVCDEPQSFKISSGLSWVSRVGHGFGHNEPTILTTSLTYARDIMNGVHNQGWKW